MKRLVVFICALTLILLPICTVHATQGAGSILHDNMVWELWRYVDEFGDDTGERVITTKDLIEGTFCNSAVKDRELCVRWLVDKDDVSLMLFEYEDNQVISYSSYKTEYSVTMRDSQGEDTRLSAYLYPDGDRLIFTEISAQKIVEAFKKGGTYRFYIVNLKRKVETYLFKMDSIDGSAFTNMWNKLNGISENGQVTVKVTADSVYLRNRDGSNIQVLPKGASITIMSYDSSRDMFYVQYGSKTGYVKGAGFSMTRDQLLKTFK